MSALSRSSFARGWLPSADAVHAPADALLRADNLVLDERGVLGLRRGSAKINGSALADTDVHSLYTAVLSGTRYRMAGANNAVYANSTSVATGTAGSGDIAFSSYLGQILWARSTTKKKYDGTTVRNWGIAAPSAAPTSAVIAADSKAFASFNSADAEFTWNDDDGTGASYTAGYDATANGAAILNPNTTGHGRITKTFGGATDFTVYGGGQVGTDDDLVEVYAYITEPQYASSLEIRVDVNDASYQNDFYFYRWLFNQEDDSGTVITQGWNHFTVRRGDFIRPTHATAGKNWSTVKSVRIDVYCSVGSTASQWRFDEWRIIGGAQRPLTGDQLYKWVAVNNTGTYTGKSAPSAASAAIEATANGVTVSLSAGAVAALDTQVNELWLYRYNTELGDYYRVGTKTGGPWVGAQSVSDTTSNDDALVTNLVLEANNTTPPDSIIGIAGPHYDRLLCLTATHVYPSQPRNLDSFDSTQPIRVGDASETAYWIAKVREEIYVGTSKDIYRFDGDWTERADGLINVAKRPLGVAHPPVSEAFALEDDTLMYLAADGWRQLGVPQAVTSGDVDLLYRGYTRHGVSPANLTTGRFRAAIANGLFTAITPEGASTTSSTVLHRYASSLQRWYRHTYAQAWRCVYREPDGTLIASDTSGFVWTLDTGTQDASTDIAVVLWTPVDDNGQPNNRKDPWELRVRANTGGATATAALHLDGSSSSSTTLSVASSGLTPIAGSLDGIATYRQSQLRVTGSFSTFLWYDYTLTYRERPAVIVFAEPKPETRGTKRKRFTGVTVILDTLGSAVTVTPVVDDVALDAQSVTTSDAVSTALTFESVVGRDLWVKIAGSSGFEFYGHEPNVIAEYPAPLYGRIPDTNGGAPSPKLITGMRMRVCTLGTSRTFTPILDGVYQSAITITSDADEPDEFTHSFTSTQLATDIAFSVDGPIELYDWTPVIDHTLPMARTLWDSGPIDLGSRVAWVTHLELKAKLTDDLTVTPYIDDVAQTAQTVTASTDTPITTYTVPLPRPVRGRQVRFVLASEGYFYLYWIEPKYRLTGKDTDLRGLKVSVAA